MFQGEDAQSVTDVIYTETDKSVILDANIIHKIKEGTNKYGQNWTE